MASDDDDEVLAQFLESEVLAELSDEVIMYLLSWNLHLYLEIKILGYWPPKFSISSMLVFLFPLKGLSFLTMEHIFIFTK